MSAANAPEQVWVETTESGEIWSTSVDRPTETMAPIVSRRTKYVPASDDQPDEDVLEQMAELIPWPTTTNWEQDRKVMLELWQIATGNTPKDA